MLFVFCTHSIGRLAFSLSVIFSCLENADTSDRNICSACRSTSVNCSFCFPAVSRKSTNPSIRTLVSFLQCRLLRVFLILPYTHSAKVPRFFNILRAMVRPYGAQFNASCALLLQILEQRALQRFFPPQTKKIDELLQFFCLFHFHIFYDSTILF